MIANADPFALRVVQWGNANNKMLPGFNSMLDQLVRERDLGGNPEAWRAMRPKVWRWKDRGLTTIEKAAAMTGFSVAEICGKARAPDITYVRFAICLALHRTGHSYPAIGRVLGGRDHSTAIHAVKQAQEMERIDIDYALLVEELAK